MPSPLFPQKLAKPVRCHIRRNTSKIRQHHYNELDRTKQKEQEAARAVVMTYSNFDIQIESVGERVYRISSVSEIGAGEGREEAVPFPFDSSTLDLRLTKLENVLLKRIGSTRRRVSADEQTVQAFGARLLAFLLHGEIGQRFAVHRGHCRREGVPCRLRLKFREPRLAALPWEFLYNPRNNSYLTLSTQTPVIRYLDLPRTINPLLVKPPLRMLGVVVNLPGLEPIDVAAEKRWIEEATARLRELGLLELTWLEGASVRALQRKLRRGSWHIFHFIGHGEFDEQKDEGHLLFARGRDAHRLSATNLGRLLGDHVELRVAFLNACEGGQTGRDIFSSTAATLVQQGVPTVIGMQYPISDGAAIEFARTFYETLAEGGPTELAVSEARKSIVFEHEGSLEWATPVMLTHAPDGVLFDMRSFTIEPVDSEPPGVKPPLRPLELPKTTLARPQGDVTHPHIAVDSTPLGFTWCWVPAGELVMGSDRRLEETPVHLVDVSAVWMSRHLVTNAQFERFVLAEGYHEKRWWTAAGWSARQQEGWTEPGLWQDEKWNSRQHPVVGVSWYEAVAFCAWATEVAGTLIRLPTEGEWEWAAASDLQYSYPWGHNSPTYSLCNYGYGTDSKNAFGRTSVVGRYSPRGDSPYGCADMAGNVREWCQSAWQSYPYRNDERNDLLGEHSRSLRGGSYYDDVDMCRTTYRSGLFPINRWSGIGFRVVASPLGKARRPIPGHNSVSRF